MQTCAVLQSNDQVCEEAKDSKSHCHLHFCLLKLLVGLGVHYQSLIVLQECLLPTVIAELSGLYHIPAAFTMSVALAQICLPQHAHDIPLHTEKLIRSIHTHMMWTKLRHWSSPSGLSSGLATISARPRRTSLSLLTSHAHVLLPAQKFFLLLLIMVVMLLHAIFNLFSILWLFTGTLGWWREGYERGVTDELPTMLVMLMRNVDMLLLLLL